MISRRALLYSAAVALAAPSLVRADSSRIPRFIPQSDLAVVDPVWSSVYALLPALDQAEYMNAVAGDQTQYWRTGVGFFAPGTPMANDRGMGVVAGKRSVEESKRQLEAAGYRGETAVLMAPADYPRVNALALVAADMLQRCGMKVDVQTTDWGGVIRRRASKAPPDKGGWSVFFTTFTGADLSNPASCLALRGNGGSAWFGWPMAPKLEALQDQWLGASDDAMRQSLAADLQGEAFEDVPFLALGQFFQPTVMSRRLTGALQGMPPFWNGKRA